MAKRLLDLIGSIAGLLITWPLILIALVAIWLQDGHSPFYVSSRVGKNEHPYGLIKLRSMVVRADRFHVDSTSVSDPRVTPVGRIIRAYKVDELPQLWNVLKGDMSLVGPRPNVQREVDLYTEIERELLSIKPGITDISSIVFSDLGEILSNSQDPNLDYNQLIRPWKSRLGLLYVRNQSLALDIQLLFLTIVALLSRKRALDGVQSILANLHADKMLQRMAKRHEPLVPYPPPGASEVVSSR